MSLTEPSAVPSQRSSERVWLTQIGSSVSARVLRSDLSRLVATRALMDVVGSGVRWIEPQPVVVVQETTQA